VSHIGISRWALADGFWANGTLSRSRGCDIWLLERSQDE